MYFYFYRYLKPFFIDEDRMSAVTMWIVGDFEKDSGRKLLLGALRHMVSNISSSLFSILPAVVHSQKYTDAFKIKYTLSLHDR